MSKKKALIRGVGVVIDDHVFDNVRPIDNAGEDAQTGSQYESGNVIPQNDDILPIVAALEKEGLPLVKYDKIPECTKEIISNIANASFLIIDWDLTKKVVGQDGSFSDEDVLMAEVRGGAGLESQNVDLVIKFIKQFRKCSAAPVLVFSKQGVDEIVTKLDESLGKKISAEIIVKRKSDVKDAVVCMMEDWVRNVPSIYVLKLWSNACTEAQVRMFREFRDKDVSWPVALYDAYKLDRDVPSRALTELLLLNMRGRMADMPIVEKYMHPKERNADKRAVSSVLELGVLIPDASLPKKQIGCGDLYKKDRRYFLVLSCDCDCIVHEQGKKQKTPDDLDLVLLEGTALSDDRLRKGAKDGSIFSEDTGFVRPMNLAYLYPVDSGKCVRFYFKRMTIGTIGEIKKKGFGRVGRVTAPYITDIRQRNSQWIQREGFPKIPLRAIMGSQK